MQFQVFQLFDIVQHIKSDEDQLESPAVVTHQSVPDASGKCLVLQVRLLQAWML